MPSGHAKCRHQDRKSTRLNSSHEWISYAVFCLKKNSTPDFVIFNSESSAFATSGKNAVSVFNVKSNTMAGPFFFTDADLDSANAILTAPLTELGMTPDTQFDFAVLALDNYFTGEITDAI